MGIEYHLNMAVTRFGLNKKKVIGNVNEMISEAMPLTENEWKSFYYQHYKNESELHEIGIKLYQKIQDNIIPEIYAITENDCINYMKNLVIRRTFEGRRTRFLILNTELLKGTGKEFNYLPDHEEDWRFRTYQIDYYHYDKERNILIGIKVAPLSLLTSQNIYAIKTREDIEHTHRDSEEKNVGYFFILYYENKGRLVKISNQEIIEKIRRI